MSQYKDNFDLVFLRVWVPHQSTNVRFSLCGKGSEVEHDNSNRKVLGSNPAGSWALKI